MYRRRQASIAFSAAFFAKHVATAGPGSVLICLNINTTHNRLAAPQKRPTSKGSATMALLLERGR